MNSESQAYRLSRGERILVVAPHWVGDAVMSLGLVQALRTRESGRDPSRISVLASNGVAAVYRASEAVDEVITAPFAHGGLQWSLRRQLAMQLREREYPFTTAYILPNSFKTALVPLWARIPRRVGYSAEGRGLLLTHGKPKPSRNNKPAMLDWYGALGEVPTGEVPRPVLKPSVALPALVSGADGLPTPFLAIAPGAEYGPAKRWPQPYFANVIGGYLTESPARYAYLLGGPKDVEVCQAIIDAVDPAVRTRVISLAGRTSLDEAIAVIGAAQAMLSNDSGLMHVAAALGVPQQAIFGSSDPRHTPPLSDRADIHWLKLDCSPCFERECPLGHTDCLNKLLPADVSAALARQLKSGMAAEVR